MILAPLLGFAAATAATFPHVPSLEELVAASGAVAHGEVLLAETAPCTLGLCTTYTVLVQDRLKGSPPELLEVTVPGGTRHGLTQRASGFPLWKEGAEVVLFVAPNGAIPLTGLITITEGRPVDPLLRRTIPETVPELASFVRRAGVRFDMD